MSGAKKKKEKQKNKKNKSYRYPYGRMFSNWMENWPKRVKKTCADFEPPEKYGTRNSNFYSKHSLFYFVFPPVSFLPFFKSNIKIKYKNRYSRKIDIRNERTT